MSLDFLSIVLAASISLNIVLGDLLRRTGAILEDAYKDFLLKLDSLKRETP